MNILSKIDYLTQRTNFDQILQTISNKEWKDIKKKNIKDILIENFVITLKQKYSLTNQQTQKLLNLIIIGFNFKIIGNTDIEYDSINCKILNIKGIDFQTLNNKKIISSLGIPKVVYENQSLEKQKMSDLWVKYIHNIA